MGLFTVFMVALNKKKKKTKT